MNTATLAGLPPQPRYADVVYRALTAKPGRDRLGRRRPPAPAPTFLQLCERITASYSFRTPPDDREISRALAWLLLAGAAVRTFGNHGDQYTPRPFTFPTQPVTEF